MATAPQMQESMPRASEVLPVPKQGRHQVSRQSLQSLKQPKIGEFQSAILILRLYNNYFKVILGYLVIALCVASYLVFTHL